MALATTEFSFEVEYFPGKRNVLADYGTRHIPDTDWPVDEQDPLELDSLFPFNAFTNVSFPIIEKHLYSSVDFEEFNRSNLVITEKNQQFTTVIHGVERVLVPTALRRSVFWAAHFPMHFGLSKILQTLKQHSLFWPQMNKQIAEFLSQCVCAKKKTDKFKKKDYSSNVLKASAVLQLCAIDLYEYNSKLYFTL